MTPHNRANLGDIAKTVIMPGDPLRAKYIAEKFLKNSKLVNEVRNIYAYTGTYKGKQLTIMASGMGNPSMGIYSYELYKNYNVENIIRIGTAGSYRKEIGLKEIVLVQKSYSKSTYAKVQNGEEKDILEASSSLNEKIKSVANSKNINMHEGMVLCTDVFYSDNVSFEAPIEHGCLAVEMESFALFANAKMLGKNAACILTISDSMVDKTSKILTPEERQKSLDTMIEIALESA